MRLRKTLLMVGALVLLGVSGSDTFAQEMGEALEQKAGHDDQEEWLDLWIRVQENRIDRMKEELQLDDESMNRITPGLRVLAKKKREIGKERLSLLRNLKTMTKNEENEAALKEKLQHLEANHAALEAVRQQEMAHIKAHLTPSQQGRYIMFQQKFKGELRDTIRKERKMRRQERSLGSPDPSDGPHERRRLPGKSQGG